MRRINHKTIQRRLVLALVLLGVSGSVNPVHAQGRALSVGTVNTMLWPWMPFESAIISAIKATDFDVLVSVLPTRKSTRHARRAGPRERRQNWRHSRRWRPEGTS
jgi:hypothetical protein